ncbi:CRISPR-associated helicase/endonuclease Cas3 [Anaerococcus vaginalis]|uniref:CRISPR-associated endonuclease Cas3-HD n=2 Tax=Anaerococcus vaginalis TaxID=33037 RepID=C7HWP3_9FIRM|nr:CRISPR-associated helicase/endonuclease Cas3 [Anaerococcus vaginalis]EEU11825.1 CRISPR-associated endonuclease Cas3-HD [Anaerococcus vaginalis ATCC 51170]QQB62016.1 CRISPR-associated helicase/endonuclease Cas3 [Anaerococcus vaginalis]
MKLDFIVKNPDKYLGHIEGVGNNKEKLEDHINKTFAYYQKILDEKNLGKVFERFFLSIFDEKDEYTYFKDLIDSVILFHDLGKINSRFQRNKLKNFEIDLIDLGIESQHSILSSFIYVYIFVGKIKNLKIDDELKEKFYYLIFLNAFVISRHHSDLSDFSYSIHNFFDLFIDERSKFYKTLNYLSKDKNIKEEFFDDFEEISNDIMDLVYDFDMDSSYTDFKKSKSKEIYIYTRLIYSILVASDFYATTDYMNGYKTKLPKIDQNDLIKIYNNSKLIKSIRKSEKDKSYEKKENINDLRTKIFLNAEKNLEEERDKNIFFLEAPTGSGKSNTAMNLSFKLLNNQINKIIYAYPFNTLVEQNKNTLLKYYKKTSIEEKISIINSITPIGKSDNEDFMKDWDYYIKSLLDRQFLHSPFIITSNVGLFNTLFSNKRKNIFGLYQLTNSVIVLDEIQAYREDLWNEIIEMLEIYSKIFNLKIIIMSATLPDLSALLDEDKKKNIGKLIKNPREMFNEPLFKNRVKINYDLLDLGKIDYDHLLNHMKENIGNHKKILVEFIRKKDAENFFKILNEEEFFAQYNILILTGDDNLRRKAQVIGQISGEVIKKTILIASQVVEAGVDIDMDIGYKDISMLENEEQFLGRIGRSALKNDAVAYFFDMADEKKIYKNAQDILTLRNKDRRKNLETKDFSRYFALKLQKAKNDRDEYAYINFEKDLIKLNFEKISKHMELIDDNRQMIELFLNRNLRINGKEINGSEIWTQYANLIENKDMDYSEKMVKLSENKAQMSDFLYRITKRDFIKYIGKANDIIGNLVYIEDGEKYIYNERLNYKNENDEFEDIL